MKKFISTLLSLVLAAALAIPVAALAEDVYTGSYGENITFNFDTATTTLTLTGTGDMIRGTRTSDQPWYSYKDSITKIVIEEGITSIGDWFGAECSAVTELQLPSSSLETIGAYVFNYSYAGDLIIPEGVDTIAWYAFSASNFKSVTIPSTVINYPVETNGGNAFSNCKNLEAVYVHEDNPILVSEDGVLYSKNHSILLAVPPKHAQTELALHPDTTSVGYTVFYMIPGTSPLTKLYIGAKLSELGNYAFSRIGTRKLKDIYFYGNAPSLGSESFMYAPPGITVHRLETATGWGDTIGSVPVVTFKASDIPDPWAPKPTFKLGDVNDDGEVAQIDGLLLLRYLAGWTVSLNEDAADINADGSIGQTDAILLLRYLAGWSVAQFA